MRTGALIMLLAVLSAGWPGAAAAFRFPPSEPSGPTTYTSPSGFVGMAGPGSYNSEQYLGLPPAAPTQACQSCPAPMPPAGPNREPPAPPQH